MSTNAGKNQSRKWLLTINNPLDYDLSHEQIADKLSFFSGLEYFCLCDETGKEGTFHTHVFFFTHSPSLFDTVKNLFPPAHIDKVRGTCKDNRAYVLKDGKKFNKAADGSYDYVDSRLQRHTGINHSDSFQEWGDIPLSEEDSSTQAEILLDMIKNGASDQEIVDRLPAKYKDIQDIQKTRSMYRDEHFRDSWRDLTVTYIFGKTGVGKTRGVMDEYGYSNVYRVTDYHHPFDSYDGQDCIIFEEFRSGIKHGDMLNYLDGYPLLLPCRYFNRQACFTRVFIISNTPPDSQYSGVDEQSRQAFFRRIHKVVEYDIFGKPHEYSSVNAYVHRYDWVQEVMQ